MRSLRCRSHPAHELMDSRGRARIQSPGVHFRALSRWLQSQVLIPNGRIDGETRPQDRDMVEKQISRRLDRYLDADGIIQCAYDTMEKNY